MRKITLNQKKSSLVCFYACLMVCLPIRASEESTAERVIKKLYNKNMLYRQQLTDARYALAKAEYKISRLEEKMREPQDKQDKTMVEKALHFVAKKTKRDPKQTILYEQ